MNCKSIFKFIIFLLLFPGLGFPSNRDDLELEIDDNAIQADLVQFCERDLLPLADTLKHASPEEIDTYFGRLEKQYCTLSPMLLTLCKIIKTHLSEPTSCEHWLEDWLEKDSLLSLQDESCLTAETYSMLPGTDAVFTKTDNPQKVQTGVILFCAGALVCRYSSLLLGMVVMAVGADMVFSEVTIKKEVKEKISNNVKQLADTIKDKGKQILSP